MGDNSISEAHTNAVIYLLQALILASILWVGKSIIDMQVQVSSAIQTLHTLSKRVEVNEAQTHAQATELHNMQIELIKGYRDCGNKKFQEQ